MIAQIAFLLLTLSVAVFAGKKFLSIRRNIFLGKDEESAGPASERWRNVLLVAFGQSKMFARPVAAVLHLFIYVAFLVTQIELLEILVDGAFGKHRFFAPYLGSFYTVVISLIEILSVLALVATLAFLARRNLLKLPRFTMAELKGWPTRDANQILFLEILLVGCIFLMNCADVALVRLVENHQDIPYAPYAHFAISGWLGPLLFNNVTDEHTLHLLERIGWWGHLVAVFGFIVYLPFSKHLHIFLAFPGTYFAKLSPKGEIGNMPDIQREVASMLDPSIPASTEIPKFGASDVFDLSWQTVLAAYSCTECGRCSSVCPANMTGKMLSPRKIVMDVRDRADEIGRNLDINETRFIKESEKANTSTLTKDNYDDKRNLFSYVSEEELRACTTCNACVEACPVLIRPLDIIVELRRNLILEKSSSPESWNGMFNNLENNGAPWAFPAHERDAWTRSL
jgi:heterodisulfide reductase subunit C